MKNIGLLGCGKSSFFLIKELITYAYINNVIFKIYDFAQNFPFQDRLLLQNAKYISCDLTDGALLENIAIESDCVISLLPPYMHIKVAKFCIKHKTHLATASYMSDEIKNLNTEAIDNDLILLMEAGLDPGLDHMSAMLEIDEIKKNGGEILAFKSFTGGLVAPESDNNEWGYKISWNPKNVATAGNGGAIFLQNANYKILPYNRLFEETEKIDVFSQGDYEVYPNRNSIPYKNIYQLDDCKTVVRGTIRKTGFCEAWDKLVKLGITDDTLRIKNTHIMSYRQFVGLFLKESPDLDFEFQLCKLLGIQKEDSIFKKLEELGLFSNKMIKTIDATPAEVLVEMLLNNLSMHPYDKDMVLMRHIITYQLGNKVIEKTIELLATGEDNVQTAMAKTVGLPLAYCVQLMIEGDIMDRGVVIPTKENIYKKVLKRLENKGVLFKHHDRLL